MFEKTESEMRVRRAKRAMNMLFGSKQRKIKSIRASKISSKKLERLNPKN